MGKIITTIALAAFAASSMICCERGKKIETLTAERDKYMSNTETLMQDIRRYTVRDSLQVATVNALTLKVSEYERFRAADASIINELKLHNRDLSEITTTQTKTIETLKTNVRDSIVFLPSDTVFLQCIDIHTPFIDLEGCMKNKTFEGRLEVRDSLIIVESVKYKRFLGFLWKTNKVKNRQIDVVSKNPHTKIIGTEFVIIEK